jgi:hypothetical protein
VWTIPDVHRLSAASAHGHGNAAVLPPAEEELLAQLKDAAAAALMDHNSIKARAITRNHANNNFESSQYGNFVYNNQWKITS